MKRILAILILWKLNFCTSFVAKPYVLSDATHGIIGRPLISKLSSNSYAPLPQLVRKSEAIRIRAIFDWEDNPFDTELTPTEDIVSPPLLDRNTLFWVVLIQGALFGLAAFLSNNLGVQLTESLSIDADDTKTIGTFAVLMIGTRKYHYIFLMLAFWCSVFSLCLYSFLLLLCSGSWCASAMHYVLSPH
jgi:hypothetical protein